MHVYDTTYFTTVLSSICIILYVYMYLVFNVYTCVNRKLATIQTAKYFQAVCRLLCMLDLHILSACTCSHVVIFCLFSALDVKLLIWNE